MKRILILCNNSGGLFGFRAMLLDRLLGQGTDLYVSTPFDRNVSELHKMGINLLETSIDRRGVNPIRDFKLFLQYQRILKKVNPDLVITYTIKPSVYGGMACRWQRVPYVVNITGLGTAFQKDGLLQKLVITMYRAALKQVKLVFFENGENRDTMVHFRIVDEDKTHVLMGAGVDLEKFSWTEYPKDDGSTRFIFIGRVMREKGVDELFSAMGRLFSEGYKCSLTVLGECEENYLEKLESYEKEGWLKYQRYQADVQLFIKQSHCFVLPSWHEGMSNANLECAAMGRPIITSAIHGCMEAVIAEESGFLCEKRNADNLYHWMKEFIELPYERKKQMGIAGRKHMETVFDKKKVVEETLQRISEL